MSQRRASTDTAPKGRGRVLRGVTREEGRSAVLELRRHTQREKEALRSTQLGRLKAVASDPEVHRVADRVDARTARDHCIGGRPREFPTVVMMIYGAAVHIYGSSSNVARTLADEDIWAIVLRYATPLMPSGTAVPTRAPQRHHWDYFLKARLAPNITQLIQDFIEGATNLAWEMGMADPSTASFSNPDRPHVVVVDGKVVTSPLGTREVQRVDKKTGEIRFVRQDTARGRHHEGGDEKNFVYGTKYAIASIRTPLPGHRIALGLQHIVEDGRGEAGAFVDLMVDIADRLPGVVGFITDGALRGEHIGHLQERTGAFALVPPRRKAEKRGGVKLGQHHYAVRTLPESRSRSKAFAACAGHDLWVGGGHILNRTMTADGSYAYTPVERSGRKRERVRDGQWSLYAQHHLTCEHTGEEHTWFEPLTPIANDAKVGFNRAEYLRAIPALDPDFDRIYGFRADSESLNAQIEYGWHKQRIPAWGAENKTSLMMCALLGLNSWARFAWLRELEHQAKAPPGPPA